MMEDNLVCTCPWRLSFLDTVCPVVVDGEDRRFEVMNLLQLLMKEVDGQGDDGGTWLE